MVEVVEELVDVVCEVDVEVLELLDVLVVLEVEEVFGGGRVNVVREVEVVDDIDGLDEGVVLVDVELVLLVGGGSVVLVVGFSGGINTTFLPHLLLRNASKHCGASGHSPFPHAGGIAPHRHRHDCDVHDAAHSASNGRHASSAGHRHAGACSPRQSAGSNVSPESHGAASTRRARTRVVPPRFTTSTPLSVAPLASSRAFSRAPREAPLPSRHPALACHRAISCCPITSPLPAFPPREPRRTGRTWARTGGHAAPMATVTPAPWLPRTIVDVPGTPSTSAPSTCSYIAPGDHGRVSRVSPARQGEQTHEQDDPCHGDPHRGGGADLST